MELIGHRGAAALGMENTLGAIAAGIAAGADGVEIDVRLCADGVPVLMHDPDVTRTTGGSGRVADLSIAALRRLGVPALEEVIEAVPADRVLVVELKGHPWEAGYDPGEPAAHAVASLLAGAGPRRAVVSSFNPLALAVVRSNAPGVPTAVLTPPAFDLASNLAGAIDGGHAQCHVPASILDADFIVQAHAAGKHVVAWTVNDAERLRAFESWGVDGVITDDPGAARDALAAR